VRKQKSSLGTLKFHALFVPKWSSRKIGAGLGCSKSTVLSWIAGDVEPSPEAIAALRALLGIELSDKWTKRDRRTLADACKPRFTRKVFSKLLKRSTRSIANYATGRQVPSTEIALLIQSIVPDVQVADWFTKP
jgi:DNA-binding transcriptional regulator YiaG